MTPQQRAAAERLADELQQFDGTERESLRDDVSALLRELAAEPVIEPAIWIQSNHLQHARNGPYLVRTGPTKLMSDFIPLYAAPQQPMRCPTDGGECGAGGYCRPEPQQRKPLTREQIDTVWSSLGSFTDRESDYRIFARAIERAHGITGEPT